MEAGRTQASRAQTGEADGTANRACEIPGSTGRSRNGGQAGNGEAGGGTLALENLFGGSTETKALSPLQGRNPEIEQSAKQTLNPLPKRTSAKLHANGRLLRHTRPGGPTNQRQAENKKPRAGGIVHLPEPPLPRRCVRDAEREQFRAARHASLRSIKNDT